MFIEPNQEPKPPEHEKEKTNQQDDESRAFLPLASPEPKEPFTANKKDDSYQEKSYRLDRKRYLVEIATLIVLGIYTLVAGYQAYKMREATRAAKQSADAAVLAVKEEMPKQTEAMQGAAKAAEQSSGLSEKSVTASIQQFRLEQRAWVAVGSVTVPEYREGNKPVYLKEGEKAVFEVNLLNSGKTPALNVSAISAYTILPRGFEFSPNYPPPAQTMRSKAVIQPGQPYLFPTSPSRGPLEKAFIDKVKAGDFVIYVFGEVKYADVFWPRTKRHITHYCLFLSPSLDQLHPCAAYNDAD